MDTPAWLVARDDTTYATNADDTGKVKRPRNNPDPLVALSSQRGKVTGPAIEAEVRLRPVPKVTSLPATCYRRYPILARFFQPKNRLLGDGQLALQIVPLDRSRPVRTSRDRTEPSVATRALRTATERTPNAPGFAPDSDAARRSSSVPDGPRTNRASQIRPTAEFISGSSDAQFAGMVPRPTAYHIPSVPERPIYVVTPNPNPRRGPLSQRPVQALLRPSARHQPAMPRANASTTRRKLSSRSSGSPNPPAASSEAKPWTTLRNPRTA